MKNKRYNHIEEWANTLSHGIGILLGIVAGYFLLEKASENMEPQWAVACVSVYLAGMLSSYVSSTWYHGSRPGKLKELLRKFDHGAIYLHIAGTYTPFTLLVLRHAGGWGWGIFAFVWLSAIAGFILSFKKLKEHSNLETACYVGMGACILVAMKPLLDHLAELGATTAFWWLIGGGVSYIVGAVFYSLRKPYMHATFHLFCLGGSIGHEVDPQRNLIKGRGGAMFKEKLLIRSSRKTFIIIDPSKRVNQLGNKFPIPVEVFPDSLTYVEHELQRLGASEIVLRPAHGKDGPVFTENGNFILDTRFNYIDSSLEEQLKTITGVIESGLFIGYDVEVIMAE